MVLIDFRSWEFKGSGFLPNAEKELLKRDFEAISSKAEFQILEVERTEALCLSSLFFENASDIAVSSIQHIEKYYKVIDAVLSKKDKEVIDYTEAGEEEVYFYGADSLVAHLNTEVALCGINTLTDESLFEEYCEDFELTPFSFDLPEGVFTSDVAFFANNKLLICLEYIKDKKQKKQLTSLLKKNGIELVAFTKAQVDEKVLNVKMLNNGRLLILNSAYDLFTEKQKEAVLDVEVIELPFLEKAGVQLKDILF